MSAFIIVFIGMMIGLSVMIVIDMFVDVAKLFKEWFE